MQSTPAISVVLPYFNAEKTLERAIRSVLNQTFSEFELILVDNNSTDGSTKIAAGFAQKDLRVILMKEKRQGVAYASNHGSAWARAPLIARMDADDEMLPQRLEKQGKHLDTHLAIGLVGGQVVYQGEASNLGFRHYVDWSNGLTGPGAIFDNRFVELPVVNPTIMFRKRLFEQYGGYADGDFPEDYEMILRWMSQGIKMDKLAEPVLKWHDQPDRLTRTDPRYSETAFFRTKAKFLAQWLRSAKIRKEIWIWGAGKLSRRRSQYLQDHGLSISGYIDVKPRQIPLACIDYREIPDLGKIFILSYVANRGKREEVREFLLQKGYLEGIDFLLMA